MVAATDVKVYKTTSNLGGAITATQVVSATPNNVFTNVPKNELVVGEDYYACVYFKNGHATESMDNFTLWLTNKSFPSNTTIKWAFDVDPTGNKYHYSPYETYDGVTDFTEQADSAALDLSQFSISAWFRTTKNYTTDGVIVNKGGFGSDTAGQNLNYGLWMNSTEKIKFGFEEGNGTDRDITSPLAYNDGLWHLATGTYDGITLRLYIDGVEVITGATTATPETDANPLRIGKNARADDRYFQGDIDEVRVWNNDLTVDEVNNLYNNGVVPQTGNVVYENKFGADAGIVAQTIADKYTAPVGVTWQEVSSAPSSPNFGKLVAGASFPVWIWYHVPANAVEILDDSETFAFRFDIPQGGTGTGGGSDCAEGTYHYEPYETYPSSPLFNNDTLTVVTHTGSLSLSQFSLACWFRTSKDYTDEDAGYMITKGNYVGGSPGNNINYGLLISTDVTGYNALEVVFDTPSANGSGHYSVFSSQTVNDGQWHLAVGTFDGDTLRLYLDGEETSSNDDFDTTGGDAPDTGTHDLIIGGHENFPTYKGDLDEVRIWNNDLTQQEITDLYNNGDIPQSSAIVYENLYGGSGGDCGGSGGSGGSPPPTNTDYKIAIAGDWGCEPETDDVIDLIQSEGYDHVVGVGDNAYESASCWTSRFNPIKSIMNSAYGNHEYSESGGTSPYKTFFGHSLTYFTYKFENIQFFVCDTNINLDDGSAQHTFMENALAASQTDNTITWRIAVMHDAWFGSDSDHAYNEFDQVQAFHQLFQNNGVRIVCCGHNHNWQRTYMVAYNDDNPESPTVVDSTSPYSNNAIGLIHVVSGTGGHDSGGSLYGLGSQPSFQAYQNRTHNGVWEIVASNNAQTLTCAFRSIDGDTFDSFTITA